MKSTSALLLVLAAAVPLLAAVQVPSELRALSSGRPGSMMSPFMLGARNDAMCQNRTKSCADCHRVNVCAYVGSGYTFIHSSTCPDSAPYCQDGECAKQPGEACQLPAVANDFTCYDGDEFQGYYPAPFDCTKYYVCSGSVPYVYNCPEGHVYDHARAACVRRDAAPAGSCYTFPCRRAAEYLLYKPDEAVYAYCLNSWRALVSKCPPNYRIDPAQPNEPCKPFCAKPGRIADHDDARVYYDCNLRATSPATTTPDITTTVSDYTPPPPSLYARSQLQEPLKQYCPPGMTFNDLAKRCITSGSGAASPTTSKP